MVAVTSLMRRYLIIGAALMAVSPLALHALGASAATTAPGIAAHPTPVYASKYATPVRLPVIPVPITTQPTVPSR